MHCDEPHPAAPPGGFARLALSGLVVVVTGCAPVAPGPTGARPTPPAEASPSPAPTAGAAGADLLLLAYAGDAASLSLIRVSGGGGALPLPDSSVAAVAPTTGGELVAVTRDGRAFVAPRGPMGLVAGIGWRPLALAGPGEMPARAIVWSGTSSPDGTRLAAIARPRDAESPSALIVFEPARGRREILWLGDESEGVAPAWIDDARVAIVQRDRLDRLFLALVEVATGRTTDRLPIRALDSATSRDAGTWAFMTDDRVVVGPTASVLERRSAPDTGPALAPGDVVRGGIALSSDGHEIALAIEEGNPGSSRIAIYERVGGAWREATRLTPRTSATGGWLTWLP